ncbi:hypothetical protein [Microcoleus sp. FACHB-672]|uniref:hypothetical protein n=1 Tax=Microcoleus sp. FACHB-672 TaxID=2692825 RepID=UPI001682BC7A|nr:hypothetical protein [Microcoleus sp. FACHB-672]MBD2039146.1 hypothetical protein [Microcoleus sp. FACHB-672]
MCEFAAGADSAGRVNGSQLGKRTVLFAFSLSSRYPFRSGWLRLRLPHPYRQPILALAQAKKPTIGNQPDCFFPININVDCFSTQP